MRLSSCFIEIVFFLLPIQVLSFLVVNEPSKGAQWVNGQTNYATWTAGARMDISMFDVELARLSTNGLLFAARNVPLSASKLPILLQDVPAADDYFLIFINSTHGAVHAMSQRFSILPAPQSSNNSAGPTNQQFLATVTVSGGPNPTASFAHTFVPTSGTTTIWMPNVFASAIMGSLISTWFLY